MFASQLFSILLYLYSCFSYPLVQFRLAYLRFVGQVVGLLLFMCYAHVIHYGASVLSSVLQVVSRSSRAAGGGGSPQILGCLLLPCECCFSQAIVIYLQLDCFSYSCLLFIIRILILTWACQPVMFILLLYISGDDKFSVHYVGFVYYVFDFPFLLQDHASCRIDIALVQLDSMLRESDTGVRLSLFGIYLSQRLAVGRLECQAKFEVRVE